MKTVTEPATSPGAMTGLLDFETLVREGLLAAAVAGALRAMADTMEAEVDELVGKRHVRVPGRANYRHGQARGSVVLGGRRVPVRRPRVRSVGGEELPLVTYAAASDDDLLDGVVLERSLATLPLRRQRQAAEPVGEAVRAIERSTSRSALSRRLAKAAESAMDELLGRDLSHLDVVVLMVDGVYFAGTCCVAALAICLDGSKVPVGLVLGDTENAAVVGALLGDLVERGLDTSRGVLAVLDGAKALSSAVARIFGPDVCIQRCQLHKRRNVAGYLPKGQQTRVDRRLARALANVDPGAGQRAALRLADELEARWPKAAASIREGLEEMFTVRRLGVDGALWATLSNTNTIESMISVARTVTRNVKRWRDKAMVRRWACLGVLHAEAAFRRVKGYRQLPSLRIALERHAADNRSQMLLPV